MNVVAFRQGSSLNTNTETMRWLAETSHATSREITQLTYETRRDSILMRNLAEVTMIFLPLTAISVRVYPRM
jgi:hypothetical protein